MTADAQSTDSLVPQVIWLEGQLRQELAARKRLVEAALQLTSTFDSDKLLQLIMSSATELLDAETSSLMLVDEETNELVIAVATGTIGAKAERQRIPIGAGIAGWTLANRQVAIVDDPATDGRFFPESGSPSSLPPRTFSPCRCWSRIVPLAWWKSLTSRTIPVSPSGTPSWPPRSPASPL